MTTQLTPPDKEPKKSNLQPPDADLYAPQKSNLRRILIIAFTLFALLDIAIFAYIFLSDKAGKQPEMPEQSQPTQKRTPPEPETSRITPEQKDANSPDKKAAEKARSQWLQQQAIAETDAVGSWGKVEYEIILQQAAAAEQLLTTHEFQQAEMKFLQTADSLLTLQASRPKLLAQSLAVGTDALLQQNSTAAAEAFARALTLAPENEQASHGLARAETLDAVISIYNKGLKAEKEANLPEAKNIFVQAQQLDPEFLPATQAHARVQQQLEEAAFNQAMGTFLLALQGGQTTLAKTALNRAAQLRPNDPAVFNGNKQLQQRILQQNLVRLQREYTTFAKAEQWQQAAKSCEQALKLDPQAAFALAGLQKTTEQLALEKALQAILDQPQRLQEQGPLQEARQVLALADAQTTPGRPRLSAQRTAVRKKIEAANRQVPVLLQSDNLTEVVIYRVGQLGIFNQRQLQLRPGKYTVVGSRPGYRDVRKELKIQTDAKQASLRIRCTEVI